ncbi:MAG TPA: peptide chain release factor N(5)-glutamine methyltransferase [Pyrinomonadaceae bacterium]|nr:peptide chain release factor N(5)-glutamine methyltransferase [Pyrinomonadaceae bacterium]
MNIAEALALCTAQLSEHDVPDARRDAVLLVAFAIGRDRTFLIAHPETSLTPDQTATLSEITARRSLREPLQYITGRQEFYKLEFEVTPDVLIPRPETEILVERAITVLSAIEAPRFCEIGVGSGCISISVLHELKNASAAACDISENAIAIARRNAEKHGVSNRLRLIVSDLFDSVPDEAFDTILSNPPYVPEVDFDSLQTEVRDYEPTIALTSGADGLTVIERLIRQAPEHLRPGGVLLFEMGFNQSGKVSEMLDETVWTDIDVLPDLQGIPRILYALKR